MGVKFRQWPITRQNRGHAPMLSERARWPVLVRVPPQLSPLPLRHVFPELSTRGRTVVGEEERAVNVGQIVRFAKPVEHH
jgi:hypothetical protein